MHYKLFVTVILRPALYLFIMTIFNTFIIII